MKKITQLDMTGDKYDIKTRVKGLLNKWKSEISADDDGDAPKSPAVNGHNSSSSPAKKNGKQSEITPPSTVDEAASSPNKKKRV